MLVTADGFILVTSLKPETFSTDDVLALYRDGAWNSASIG
jgi:hypothetical protein